MRALTDYRAEFPILSETTYLANHTLGAMPRTAAERLAGDASMWGERGGPPWGGGGGGRAVGGRG